MFSNMEVCDISKRSWEEKGSILLDHKEKGRGKGVSENL